LQKIALTSQSKEFTDDGVYSTHRRNIIVPESDWDDDIRSNVITTLPIIIEDDLRYQLIELAKQADYNSYYKLNFSNLSNNPVLNRIIKTFGLMEILTDM
jgi:hypothetical protein